ncbi:MAG: TolC family protein, partial [Pseudomonadales bacterium]|nr:TolC family protein [Pseudomonadales bacterium]
AEVARSYLQLRGNQYRLDVNQRNADTLEQSYQLTQEMVDGGLGNALDVQRALAQWELVRSRIPGIEAQINILINRLGVLTGQMPSSLHSELSSPAPLPDLPVSVALGEPVDLLKRRPDIRYSEHQLAAALAGYELSVAELYPAVNLSGSIGFVATTFANLGSGGTLTHLLAPQLSWQAFNLGRVQAQIDAADAHIQGQLELFEKTVLLAFEEVDNSLSFLNHEAERRARLFAAAEASARAAGFAMERFESGTDSYLDVLDAQRTQLEAEDQLVVSEVELALQLVSLYKALGGGWQMQ